MNLVDENRRLGSKTKNTRRIFRQDKNQVTTNEDEKPDFSDNVRLTNLVTNKKGPNP